MRYARVKKAYSSKWSDLKQLLASKGIAEDKLQLHLQVYKKEEILEIWARKKSDPAYQLIKTISICAGSGVLGPKRKEGDGQVPEGFYEVSWFNPMSDYHLGLKVNYPNASDRVKANGRPGGDIMIHGKCVTIGCIPLQDEPIEELYVLSVEAMNAGNKVSVHIYPAKMEQVNLEKIIQEQPEHESFWRSMKPAYDHFIKHKSIPVITTDKKGDYKVATP